MEKKETFGVWEDKWKVKTGKEGFRDVGFGFKMWACDEIRVRKLWKCEDLEMKRESIVESTERTVERERGV